MMHCRKNIKLVNTDLKMMSKEGVMSQYEVSS